MQKADTGKERWCNEMTRNQNTMPQERLRQKQDAGGLRKDFRKNWILYLMILPVVIYYIIFIMFQCTAFRSHSRTMWEGWGYGAVNGTILPISSASSAAINSLHS